MIGKDGRVVREGHFAACLCDACEADHPGKRDFHAAYAAMSGEGFDRDREVAYWNALAVKADAALERMRNHGAQFRLPDPLL